MGVFGVNYSRHKHLQDEIAKLKEENDKLRDISGKMLELSSFVVVTADAKTRYEYEKLLDQLKLMIDN